MFRVEWDAKRGITGDTDFRLEPKDDTTRGLRLVYPLAGQTIRVLVLCDNGHGTGIELLIPSDPPPSASIHLSVKHRPVDRFGLSLVPWSEVPPAKVVGGFSIAQDSET